MKLLFVTFAALLSAAPASLAQADHFDVYKPWSKGEAVARDWFLRTEPGGIGVIRSDVFPTVSMGGLPHSSKNSTAKPKSISSISAT